MDGMGWLDVRVYTSQAQIPVAGATVLVTGAGRTGKRKLLSVQTTDSSGSIKTIMVETPLASQSTSPGMESPGFILCDVWAEHPGFATLMVEGVQVFPGIGTFLPMELTPLEEGRQSLQETDLRKIPGQTL